MGEEREKVVVSTANIQIDVSVPKEKVTKFIQAFRERFDTPDFTFGVLGRNMTQIRVTVPISRKYEFYNFVSGFCRNNQLELTMRMEN